MKKNLLTPLEVIKNTPISSKVGTKFICDQIPIVEMCFVRECLGFDFYERLLKNANSYGKIQDYDPNKVYNIGDKVNYYGILLESCKNNNGINPCDDITDNWKTGKKFKNKCFNDLWCNGLMDYLSFAVLCESLEYMTYEIGAQGLIEKAGEHYRTASNATFKTVKTKVIRDTNIRKENLLFYIKSNAEKCGWQDCLFMQNTCDPCGDGNKGSCLTNTNTGRRKIYFKN